MLELSCCKAQGKCRFSCLWSRNEKNIQKEDKIQKKEDKIQKKEDKIQKKEDKIQKKEDRYNSIVHK